MSDAPTLLRDRYRLGELLGSGSGSSTYLAQDHATGDRCVVKALSVGGVVREASRTHSYDSDDFTKLIELFEREARVLAHLDHPGIPRLVDHFTEQVDGDVRLYTVQEYVPGRTLQELVEGGRHFTEAEARDVCRRLAEILEYLHGRSPPLIHRDIKPRNVILDDDGTVHLVDFGSVRNAIGGDRLDGKTIVGTYGYMPMEQYEARALPQSDLYALGMTLVFVLSHREPTDLPRTGMTLAFRPHVNVSDDFARVLERMIEPAPEDRYASASALLRELAAGADVAPRDTEPLVPLAANRVLLAVASGAVALAIAIGFFLANAPAPLASPLNGSVEGIVDPGPPVEPVGPEGGVLAVDIYRDFRYTPRGWPMGRSVGQTPLPGLTREPFEDLVVPDEWDAPRVEVLYGFFPLGNARDNRTAFALVSDRRVWSLHVDLNDNEDLTDDGPPTFNEGTGTVLAAEVAPSVDVVVGDGERVVRPYHLWVWFNEPDDGGRIRGFFYARNHYRGRLLVEGRTYEATAFEFRDHDALYHDSGLCIDLDADGECQEDGELFLDGEVVGFPGGAYPLALRYP